MMNNSHVADRQHGLTLVQWVFLFVAFMMGLGGTFVIRDFFPQAHASVVQTAPSNSVVHK